MYDRIFNTLAVLTFGGVLFIAGALPFVFESDEEIEINQALFAVPAPQVEAPNMSQVIHDKKVEDAFAKISEAALVYELATSVKEYRNFEPYQYIYVGEFYLTMYAATLEQCGSTSGITASGRKVTDDPKCHTVAVDPSVIPLGTYLIIEGYEGIIFRADDTGSAVKGYHIDIFTTDEYESLTFNNKSGVKVWIVEEVC